MYIIAVYHHHHQIHSVGNVMLMPAILIVMTMFGCRENKRSLNFEDNDFFFSLSLYLFCAHCLNFSFFPLFFFCVFGVIQCLLIEVNWYSFCYFDHCSATFICHFMSIHDCLISYFQWFWNDVCFDFGVYQYYYSNAFPGIRYKVDTRT